MADLVVLQVEVLKGSVLSSKVSDPLQALLGKAIRGQVQSVGILVVLKLVQDLVEPFVCDLVLY